MPENNDLIGWMRKNNRDARAARTLAEFFDVVCQMTTSSLVNLYKQKGQVKKTERWNWNKYYCCILAKNVLVYEYFCNKKE